MRRLNVVWLVVTAALVGLGIGLVLRTRQAKKPHVEKASSVEAWSGVQKLKGGKVVFADSAEKTLVGYGMRHVLQLIDGDSTAHPYDESAYFCIGNDSTATDTSMTAAQGATKKWGMADSLVKATTTLTWWRTFTTAQANQLWAEICFFNDSVGTMLDRRTASWGTKTTADTWTTFFKLRLQ